MKVIDKAYKVLAMVEDYYHASTGVALTIERDKVCFCSQNPDCPYINDSPIIIPDIESNRVAIHIASIIDDGYYPIQIVYQYAHELWHAYEFQLFGTNWNWRQGRVKSEGFAHAAALSVLSKAILPPEIMSSSNQVNYFKNVIQHKMMNTLYEPGRKIAVEVNYELDHLYDRYKQEIGIK